MESRNIREPLFVRAILISVVFIFLALFLVLPLVAIFSEALRKGFQVYLSSFASPDAMSAIRLTLLTAAIAVPLNTIFGVALSWAIAKFDFRGKNVLITLIDLPLAISPVISGMIYMLMFGLQGWLGPWLLKHDVRLMFAVPGILLATVFVTFPFVARELIPLMQGQGKELEEAAVVLGAGAFRPFGASRYPI